MQRLLQSFKENQYPLRAVKESLATELELSVPQVSKFLCVISYSFFPPLCKKFFVIQVSKWFENARHSFRHSPRKSSDVAKYASDEGTPCQKQDEGINLSESEPKSVLDNATCGKGKKKKQGKGTTAVIERCDKDMTSNMVAEEGNRHTRSKRKAKFGIEAPEPNTSLEMPKQNADVNPPKTQGVRKSSRIQSKSKESVS